jgi:hypothetical protein
MGDDLIAKITKPRRSRRSIGKIFATKIFGRIASTAISIATTAGDVLRWPPGEFPPDSS